MRTTSLVSIALLAAVCTCSTVMAQSSNVNSVADPNSTQGAARPKVKFAAKPASASPANTSDSDAPQPSGLDQEQIPGLDPYAHQKGIMPQQSSQPQSQPQSAQDAALNQHKHLLLQGLQKLGHDLEKTIKDSAKGAGKLVKTAAETPDAFVVGTDAVVKGAEKAPAVIEKGAGTVVNDVAFPKDAQTMDYDGDI